MPTKESRNWKHYWNKSHGESRGQVPWLKPGSDPVKQNNKGFIPEGMPRWFSTGVCYILHKNPVFSYPWNAISIVGFSQSWLFCSFSNAYLFYFPSSRAILYMHCTWHITTHIRRPHIAKDYRCKQKTIKEQNSMYDEAKLNNKSHGSHGDRFPDSNPDSIR